MLRKRFSWHFYRMKHPFLWYCMHGSVTIIKVDFNLFICLSALEKNPDAGGDWGQEEKRATEDEMVAWHHWLSGHDFEQNQRESEWLGSLAWLQSVGSQRVGHDWATEQQQQLSSALRCEMLTHFWICLRLTGR